MGLDYSRGCVNFRDVGEYVNLIAQTEVLPEKRILRGGKLDDVPSLEAIGNPHTIINLRRGEDTVFPTIANYHFPISNDYEKYDTRDKEVRRWLNRVVQIFENPHLDYPVLIHCTSGKDRTGVVVAALLWMLAVPENIIVEEYLLSDGEINKDWIASSLEGMKSHTNYFYRVDSHIVRSHILGVQDL